MEATADDAGKSGFDKMALDEPFIIRQKKPLEEEREILVREIEVLDEDEREWNEGRRDAPDFGSYASAMELDMLLENKIGHRLALVQRALEKIVEGTYGVCDVTGQPIPRRRLEAIPEAIHTLETLKDSGAEGGRR